MFTRRADADRLAGAAAVLLLGCASILTGADRPGRHPKLLIGPDDIPRLRHACGIAAPGEADVSLGRAGARAREFQSLRAHFAQRLEGQVLPGELLGAAFLHLVEPSDPFDPQRVELINQALRGPLGTAADLFETVVALDWCWNAVDPQARQEFLLSLRKQAAPLTPADSPLDRFVFWRKLATLAAAWAVDEQDEPGSAWADTRQRLLAAGREYFRATLPAFVRWRGLSPTSPSAGPWEERDTALAVELAGHLLESEVWPQYRASVGRWLEHYVYASFAHPALQHHFIRDDGNLAPLNPAPRWDEMLPLTAHLIAVRTHDPAAALVAQRVEHRMRGATAQPLAAVWQWVPIVLDTRGIGRCDFSRLPGARNLGGAVVFRGRDGPQETGVWIEAGQPFLRRRQHYDAGHFLIYADGHLAVAGGDDVTFEAVTGKQGFQRLGNSDAPFDFEQYFAATIAHNCLLLWDPVRFVRWYGRPYEPVGGQRLIEDTCTDFTAPLEGHVRQTARMLAYGQRPGAAYLALDLLPAYDSRTATSYTREFVFIAPRMLVIIDRLARRSPASPIWIVNIPARPTIDGADLPDAARIAGPDNDAGIWQCDDVQWLRWCAADGCLRMASLLPAEHSLRVVGGPGRTIAITDGPHAGRTYLGSSPDGFERLVRPAGRSNPPNAWYRLGRPTLLGPAFGQMPHWGRVEIEPTTDDDPCVFLTLLLIETPDALATPEASVVLSDEAMLVKLEGGADRAELHLPRGTEWGGAVQRRGRDGFRWTLPREVNPDDPLPTH